MPRQFQLEDCCAGFPAHRATETEIAEVITGELISPYEPDRVEMVLESLQHSIFKNIPGFPQPPMISHLLVLIRPDLSATAYINEVVLQTKARPTRDVEAGEAASVRDISAIEEVVVSTRVSGDGDALSPVDIPDDAALIVMTAIGWRRSVYYDFGPRLGKPRIGTLSQVLAQQLVMLLGLAGRPAPSRSRVDAMADGYQALRRLLAEKCQEEAQYQRLLEAQPWMLGGNYAEVRRHAKLDDENIPDFTAVRSADGFHDIIELKQPFLDHFKLDGDFAADFNDAWNQAERYVQFAREEKRYLAERKNIRCENPRCILLIGSGWNEDQLKRLRRKESGSLSVRALTYDQLLSQANQFLQYMRIAMLPES